MIKCLAFDCFGTLFDMSPIPASEIRDYVTHVRSETFTPYTFPESWFELKAFPDVAPGIRRLQEAGFFCLALSNGSLELIQQISYQNGILWDYEIDLVKHQVYKPHPDAYRTVEKDTGYEPFETLMVTANPTFGDLEGSASIGMLSQVIRNPGEPQTVMALADLLD